LMLSGVCGVSYAETIPATLTSVPPIVKYTGYTSLLDTPEAACQDWVAHQFDTNSYTGLLYDHYEPYIPGNFNMFKCYIRNPNGYPPNAVSWWSNTAAMRSCDGIGGWVAEEITCTKYTCPVNQNWTLSGDKCTRPDCPVLPLTHPPFSDACSTSLEAGNGVDVNNKCAPLRDDMKKAASCIADKIKALSSPKLDYSSPSATVRTAEYQNHLREIWDKSKQFDNIMQSFVYTEETKQACLQRKAEIDSELQKHAIDSQPSSSESKAPHVERRAIDIPRSIAKELIRQVTMYTTTTSIVNGRKVTTKTLTSDVEDYIHNAKINPPACDSKISWGGRFNPVDRVHFQLPK
jgi:hypothetical protein